VSKKKFDSQKLERCSKSKKLEDIKLENDENSKKVV
jgi:hypothetical protein